MTRALLTIALGLLAADARAQDANSIADAPAATDPAPLKPALFTDLSLEVAVARSAQGRLTVVSFTASWCGPCKSMDRTTWIDEDVVAWIGAHGVAISLDADANRADADRLRVSALPTVVVFRGGAEYERRTGYIDGPGMLAWLQGMAEGRRLGDDARRRLAEAIAAGMAMPPADGNALAAELRSFGDLDGATDACAWAWEHAAQADQDAACDALSPMMTRLAREHPPARARFGSLLERAEALALNSESARREWLTLCLVLGEDATLLAWVGGELERSPTGRSLRPFEDRLTPVLERAERWTELGRVIADPGARAEALAEELRQRLAMRAPAGSANEEADNRTNRELALAWYRERAATLIGVLFAGERAAEARGAWHALVALDNTPAFRVAVVERAAMMRALEPDHAAWLDEAARAGADVAALRARIGAMK